MGGGFTIPDGVQVRLVGPAQTVDTQLGAVQDAISQQLTIKNNNISGNAEQGILIRATQAAQAVADIQDNVVAGNNTSVSATGIEVETNKVAPKRRANGRPAYLARRCANFFTLRGL
ncbi:MAG: DUF1565 domain-containing protein [Phormidesmis sp.]